LAFEQCEQLAFPTLPQHNFAVSGQEIGMGDDLSPEECMATLELEGEDAEHLIDVFGDCQYEAFDRTSCRVHLKGFGYRWLRKSALHPTKSSEEGH
jgi:hypothetical protein